MTGPLCREVAMALHGRAIERFGGSRGVRDAGLLDAALTQPWQTFGGVELYPTPEEKIARLCFEVVTQHPFVDGNKRVAAVACELMIVKEGYEISAGELEKYKVYMLLAAGDMPEKEFIDWLRQNSRKKVN